MPRKEQIIDIAAKFYLPPVKSMKDVVKMDQWCEDLANEIMALPLEVPSDGEINAKAIDHKRHESLSTVDYYATGIVVGAKWAIEEIKRRNQK